VTLTESKRSPIKAPPEWGVQPVPKTHKYLGTFDYFVLWTSLGKGLLVFWAGSLLVPQLDFNTALLIIVAGSLIGSLPLALAGIIGSDNSIPTMVMLRPSFGIYGSYLPSLLNIVQLVGWTTFEIVVMSLAADQVSQTVFNYSNFYLWVVVFATVCILMGILGPLAVVRQWLEKFAVWVLYGSVVWIVYIVTISGTFPEILGASGEGGLPLLLAMDIVIAMPISWMPLVSDYNRFARSSREGFWGTYTGYVVANVIGYGVGALLVLSMATADVVAAILLVQLGVVALLFILIYEVDNGFADLYSAAVSIQNIVPWAKQRLLIVGLGVLSMVLAMLIPVIQYEEFLFLIGSVFIPLFGVAFTDYFIIRKRSYDLKSIYESSGAYRHWRGVNLRAVASWIIGVTVYRLILIYTPELGASIPTLLASALIYWIFNKNHTIQITNKPPPTLTIAGSDSGGGAGIQADLKTFAALGVFGMSALTSVTAQNTKTVTSVQDIDPEVVKAQIKAVVEDIGVDVVKPGMLHTSKILDVV
jgi:putative hydroxymethylpyrimidine transporter CytX